MSCFSSFFPTFSGFAVAWLHKEIKAKERDGEQNTNSHKSYVINDFFALCVCEDFYFYQLQMGEHDVKRVRAYIATIMMLISLRCAKKYCALSLLWLLLKTFITFVLSASVIVVKVNMCSEWCHYTIRNPAAVHIKPVLQCTVVDVELVNVSGEQTKNI